ncbi:HD-GYP domain-containing protein [Dendrosporobacter sp. 1207_IL3150]|uniref:HD-GYP domain-containing protein n=1 Tax=Dendrosporobacter sp. 1207_IL3150 TaxID=3084054 RepID=UPI002FD87E6E
MRIENAIPGMVLSQDLLDDYGNLLLEKGITLTEAYINRLKRLGIRTVWVEDPLAYTLKNEPISPELRTELALCIRSLYKIKSNDILTAKLQNLYLRQITKAANAAIDEIQEHVPNIINLQLRHPSIDEVNHAVNVCLLSLVTGIYLKLSRPLLRDLVVGALLHDIGKSLVVTDSASNPGFHALCGHEILSNAEQSFSVCRIAAEHHEKYDGTGYPARIGFKDIHPLARIVAIANYYDNAMQRAGLTGSDRQDVLEDMMSKGNAAFDLNMLRAFFHTVALYPVGTVVRLSTGQTGYVIKNYAHYPLRPVVRTIVSEDFHDIDLLYKPSTTIIEIIKE